MGGSARGEYMVAVLLPPSRPSTKRTLRNAKGESAFAAGKAQYMVCGGFDDFVTASVR